MQPTMKWKMSVFVNNGICKPAPLLNSSAARRCLTRPTTSSYGEVTSEIEFEKTIEKSSHRACNQTSVQGLTAARSSIKGNILLA